MHYLSVVMASALAAAVAGGASAAVVGALPTARVSFGAASIEIPLSAIDANGGFGGRTSIVLCDGSVREAAACASGEELDALVGFVVAGSVFPFIDGLVTFVDAGSPTSLTVSFVSLIPVISGGAITSILGSVTIPSDRLLVEVKTALTDAFVEGIAGGPGGTAQPANVGVSSIVPDAVQPTTANFGPLAGTFDCASIGGCDLIGLGMGLIGHGGGASYTLSGRFDLDPQVAPIPVPAALPLLLGALGALGLAARRRRG